MPSLMATIGLNASNFNSVASQVKGGASKLGASISGAFGSIGGQLAGVFSVAAIGSFASRILDTGGKVQDLSNKLGISTDAIQQWDYALKQNGSTIEAAVPFFQRLSQARDMALEGNEKAISDFHRLGVSMDMLKTKRVEDIARVIASGFEAGDPQQLMAPLVNVGGRGAMAMAAAFRDGLADALGEAPLINPQDIESLDAAADAMGRLKAQSDVTFAPFVVGLAEIALAGVDMFRTLYNTIKGGIDGIIESFVNLDFKDLFTGKSAREGAKKAFDETAQSIVDRDAAAEEKRKRLKKGNQGAFDPEAILAGQEEKESAKAKEKADAKAKKDAEKEANAEKKLFDTAEKQQEKEALDAARAGKHSVGGLQQMGGFLGNFAAAAGPEVAAATATIRSERHLADILKELRKKANGGGGTSEETEY